MRYLVLTDIHANLEALDACLADARRARLRPHARARRHRRLRTRSQRRHRSRRSLNPVAIVRGNHDKVALRHRAGRRVQRQRARARRTGRSNALTPEHTATGWSTLPQGPTDRRRRRRDLPRLAVRRRRVHLRRARRTARDRRVDAPLCLFGHTHFAVAFRLAGDASIGVGDAAGAKGWRSSRNRSTWSTRARSVSRATAIRAPPTPSSTRTRSAWRCTASSTRSRRTQEKMADGGAARSAHPPPLGGTLTRRPVTQLPISSCAARSSRRLSSIAYASRAARDPRIQPMHQADQQDRRDEDEVAGGHRVAPPCRRSSSRMSFSTLRQPARSSRDRTASARERTRRRR